MNSFPKNSAIVLVHGAWADGSCWKAVVLPLERKGFEVICAPIPLTSLTDDVAALTRTLERTSGPVVLAGHAYGGAVIGAIRDERVKSFIYVAALAPDQGDGRGRVLSGGTSFRSAQAGSRQVRLYLDAKRRIQPGCCSQGSCRPDKSPCRGATPDFRSVHTGNGAGAGMEGEAFLVSARGRGPHDPSEDSAIHGGPNARQGSLCRCGPQSDVYRD